MIQETTMSIKRIPYLPFIGATVALALFLACGGNTPTAVPIDNKAKALSYTDPTGSGWRLVQNSSSTPGHLVLDLMAPANTAGQGIGFKLSLDDTKAQWAKVSAQDPTYVKNQCYDLGSDASSELYRGKVTNGDLVIGVYQKGIANPVIYSGALVSVAIDYKASDSFLVRTPVSLVVTKAKHVASDGTMIDFKTDLQVGKLQGK